MMGKGLISLMFTAGACTWIYTKLQRTSGNNTQRSLTAVAITGVLIFVVFYLVLNMFIK
ncbi:MAG: hypothetical protein AAB541_03335 [Patescibacteria group bacterium]